MRTLRAVDGYGGLSASLVVLHVLLAAPPARAEEPAKATRGPRVESLAGALEFAQADNRVAPGLKLEAVKLLRTASERNYSLTFRDGKQSQVITIQQDGDFKTQTRPGPADRPGFWESAPSPASVVATTEERIGEAQEEVKKAGAEPGDVVVAEYRAGYRQSDSFTGQWTIHVGLKGADVKGKVKAKTVVFQDGRVTKVSDGELQLYKARF